MRLVKMPRKIYSKFGTAKINPCARALQLLARMAGREKKYVEQALHDENSDVRVSGLRIARQLRLEVTPYLKTLAKDPSAKIRLECALALRQNASSTAPEIWAGLAVQHDGKDRWYLEALGIGADKQEDWNVWAGIGTPQPDATSFGAPVSSKTPT